jgi:hypothetical protein
MKIKDSFTINAPKSDVWDIFQDIDKLAAWMPGCKSMKTISETEYEAEMEVKTRFMTVTFTANGQIKDKVEGEEMLVEIVGTPMKLAGLFKTRMKAQFREVSPSETEVVYEMDLQMMGRLASLGDVLMKGVVKKSANEFADNVRNHFATRSSAS